MIYTIERRTAFSGGSMESWYECRSYERRTAIGVLVGAKILKKAKKKSECRNYFGKKGITYEER